MTRFKNILKRTYRKDETLVLLKRKESSKKDDLGFSEYDYVPVKKLCGIIQKPQNLDIDFKGQESNPAYIAYLIPNFDIERESLNEYRIEYKRPYERMILKIIQYNPNLFLRHKRHHVELHLILEKKYNGK